MGVPGPREGFDFLCALSHTQPRVLLPSSFPTSFLVFRPYVCSDFSSAFVYLFHSRVCLAFHHTAIAFTLLAFYFPRVSLYVVPSVPPCTASCFPPRFPDGVSPMFPVHSLWVSPCVFPFVTLCFSCEFRGGSRISKGGGGWQTIFIEGC